MSAAGITYCPHPLTLEGRSTRPVAAGRTLAEALAEAGIVDTDLLAVEINGQQINYRQQAGRTLAPGDVVAVRVVMQGGGGDSNPIAVIATIALLTFAQPLALNLAVSQLGFQGVTGAAITAAKFGIVAVGQLAINALFPPDAPGITAAEGLAASPTYSLSGARNTPRPHGPLPLIIGKHRVSPDFGSLPYTELDSKGREHLNMIFNFGYGKLDVSQLKIGETDFESLHAAGALVLGGGLSLVGSALPRIGYRVSESLTVAGVSKWRSSSLPSQREDSDRYYLRVNRRPFSTEGATVDGGYISAGAKIGITVNGRNMADLFPADFADVTVKTSGSIGEVSGKSLTGLKRFEVKDIIAKINAADGTSHTSMALDFSFAYYVASGGSYGYRPTPSTSVTIFLTAPGIPIHPNVQTHPNLPLSEDRSEWTSFSTGCDVHQIGIDIIGRLVSFDSRGSARSNTVTLGLEYRKAGESAWLAMASLVSGRRLKGVSGSNFTVSHDSLDALRLGLIFAMPEIACYEIRMRRVSVSRTSDRDQADLSWRVKAYRSGAGIHDKQNRMAVRLRASEQLSGTVDDFNCIVQARCRGWSAASKSWQDNVATSSPADWLAAFAVGDAAWGMGLKGREIDWDSIQEWHAFCALQKLEANMVIDRPMSAGAVAQAIARCGRALISWQSGKMGVVWDAPLQPPVAAFSADNIVAGSLGVSYRARPDVDEVEASYIDASQGWRRRSIRELLPGKAAASRTQRMELFGITSPDIAAQEARLASAAIKYRNVERYSWETALAGLSVAKGDVVTVDHDMLSHDGRRGKFMREAAFKDPATYIDAPPGADLSDPRWQRRNYLAVIAADPIPSGAQVLVYDHKGDAYIGQYVGGGKVLLRWPNSIFSRGLGLTPRPVDGRDVAKWEFVVLPEPTPNRRVKVVSVEPLDAMRVRMVAVPDRREYYEAAGAYDFERGKWPHRSNTLSDLPASSVAIHDATELAAMQSNGVYHLANDIDVEENWAGLTNLTGVTLDGRHHKIKRLNNPLFGGATTDLTLRNVQFQRARIAGVRYSGIIVHRLEGANNLIEQVSTCPQCSVHQADDQFSQSEGPSYTGLFMSRTPPSTRATIRNVLGRGRVISSDSNSASLFGFMFGKATVERCVAQHAFQLTTDLSPYDRGGILHVPAILVDEEAGSSFFGCYADMTWQVTGWPKERVSALMSSYHTGNVRDRFPSHFSCKYSSRTSNPALVFPEPPNINLGIIEDVDVDGLGYDDEDDLSFVLPVIPVLP